MFYAQVPDFATIRQALDSSKVSDAGLQGHPHGAVLSILPRLADARQGMVAHAALQVLKRSMIAAWRANVRTCLFSCAVLLYS